VSNFDQGDRVMTPGGVGTVKYRRMGSPDYSEVVAYSVVLDHANHNPLYTGSLYPAKEVSKATEDK